MYGKNMGFLEEELALAKEAIPKIEGCTLITCVAAQVRASYKKTDQKHLNVILQFTANYPDEPIVTELTSKTLPEKLLTGLVRMCDEEAKRRVGQKQIMPIINFVRNFVIENPLCVCSDEIAAIKKELLTESDRLKLKQDTSQVLLKITQDRYLMNLKLTVPDIYPLQQVTIESDECNFPDLLRVYFLGQAVELARKCVQPPKAPNPKEPPFKKKPSLKVVCDFLIRDCVKRYPKENCPLCNDRVLLSDPQAVATDRKMRVERVYCGHLFHHGCLGKYLKTPPFKDGKFCPSCGKQIFHDKWKVTAEVAEARWAHKQARTREVEEVTDFLK